LTSLALHHSLRPSAPSLAQASLPHGPSLQSIQLALHACNRSIKPSLVLIFSTLVTWLHVILICNELLHHMCESCNISKPFHLHGIGCSHMMYLWTNHLCISHLNPLVHLGCYTITKTKQGPFILPLFGNCWQLYKDMKIKLKWINVACPSNFIMCKWFWTSTTNPNW
jgi:hypothetical protein